MRHGYDRNTVLTMPIDDPIRETTHKTAAGTATDWRIGVGELPDAIQSIANGLAELPPEAWGLPVVILDRRVELRLSRVVEIDVQR